MWSGNTRLSRLLVFDGKSHRNGLLEAVLPTPRLQFEMTRNVSLYVGANMKQTSYRVDDDFGDANGIPQTQPRDPDV